MMYWAFWSIDWFTYWLFVSIFSYFADYFTFILQETGTCSILWNGGWCQQHQLQPQPQQSLQQPSQQQQQSLQQPSQPLLSPQHTARHQQGRLKKKNPIGHESYKHLQKYKYCSKNPFFTNCFFRLTFRAFGKFLVCNVPVQYLASVQKAHTKDVKWLGFGKVVFSIILADSMQRSVPKNYLYSIENILNKADKKMKCTDFCITNHWCLVREASFNIQCFALTNLSRCR